MRVDGPSSGAAELMSPNLKDCQPSLTPTRKKRGQDVDDRTPVRDFNSCVEMIGFSPAIMMAQAKQKPQLKKVGKVDDVSLTFQHGQSAEVHFAKKRHYNTKPQIELNTWTTIDEPKTSRKKHILN